MVAEQTEGMLQRGMTSSQAVQTLLFRVLVFRVRQRFDAVSDAFSGTCSSEIDTAVSPGKKSGVEASSGSNQKDPFQGPAQHLLCYTNDFNRAPTRAIWSRKQPCYRAQNYQGSLHRLTKGSYSGTENRILKARLLGQDAAVPALALRFGASRTFKPSTSIPRYTVNGICSGSKTSSRLHLQQHKILSAVSRDAIPCRT